MNLSYWEIQSWLSDVDFTIVGSGIVGLSCALELRRQHPKAKIIILEKGMFPQGASTKNAGFACFGSLSEILDDLNHHTEDEVLQLVQKRLDGLASLRETLGDKAIDFKQWGGYELFLNEHKENYDFCFSQMSKVNQLLQSLYQNAVFNEVENTFGFKNIFKKCSWNKFEGQLDTGKMMQALLSRVAQANIQIINSCQVIKYEEGIDSVEVLTPQFEFKTSYLLIATNGFAGQLLRAEVTPARAQVLITSPIPDLKIEGAFHLDKGYYYFRNINNRILLGGGRNLDFETEETIKFGQTALVQNRLEALLNEVIIPDKEFEIEQRWSGIMGVGPQKKPIIRGVGDRTFIGVRLGGMGVAMGSSVGKSLAQLAS